MQAVVGSLEMLRRVGRKLGPYLMLEILLPGGTLLALLLFLYRRNKRYAGTNPPRGTLTLNRVLGRIAEQGIGSWR
jgi:hypothetical protein